MRLDRFLSNQTTLSRTNAQIAIRAGQVTVNGTVLRKPDAAVSPEYDCILWNGKQISYQAHHYFLMHKPAGVISASDDPKQKTVLDLLKPEDCFPKLFPCGRLDIDTTGLLLITDDGDLAHRMLSPKHHVPKYYLATLRDPFNPQYVAWFRAGITLGEKDKELQYLPAEIAAMHTHTALICLHEGKYHQVKRMLAAVGNHVEQLMRIRIGNLSLPVDLPVGSYFSILHNDVEKMLNFSDFEAVCALSKAEYSSYWIK